MKLYADSSIRRTRQMVGDVLLLVWVLVWWLVAQAVHDATLQLATPGRELNEAGSGLADQLRDAGSAVDDAPLVGDDLSGPFEGAGNAADQLANAGSGLVDAVDKLAFWLSLSVGAVPILIALAVYVPARWRFVRTATASQRFIDAAADLDLFALRAIGRQPMHRLATVSDDPAGAWRRGDQDVIRKLALLELRDVGLKAPPAAETART